MARDIQVLHEGEIVSGRELDFKANSETAGEYVCEDGSVVRLKTIVNRIVRLNDKRNAAGEPIFVVSVNTSLSSSPAA